jgi:DNA polymerase I-like protein with 3'-5' exonuclease and polymerase domains
VTKQLALNFEGDRVKVKNDWQLPKMEDLSRYQEIVVDTETSGLHVWKGDAVLGVALGLVRDDGKIDSRYYAFGHDGGEQYTKSQVREFLVRELVNKKLIFHNSVFDLLMLLRMGVDLRQINEIHDTMYAGILVNPSSFYSLDAMYAQYVDPNVQKLHLPFAKDDMQSASSDEVGSYGERDVEMTGNLHVVMQKHIDRKYLNLIYRLECGCSEATTEMLNNGLAVDTEKLYRWVDEVDAEVKQLQRSFGKINPNSPLELIRKFDELGLPYASNYACVECSAKLRRAVTWVSKGDEKRLAACPYCHVSVEPKSACFSKEGLHGIDHPFVKQIIQLRGMTRLHDTFLKPWAEQIVDGVLPFELSQLRDRDYSGATKGTVTGRYSSSMIDKGAQPQQIWSAEKQADEIGVGHILRELFISGTPGAMVGACDASQIEFRLFANYAFDEDDIIAKAYQDDPFTDYHDLVGSQVLQNEFPRKQVKTFNFGSLYGMGLATFARRLFQTMDEARVPYNKYHRMFPQVRATANYYDRMARCDKEIRTIRGRLFEFGLRDKTHIALSRLIQGSAADLMKEALVKLFRAKLYEKMRITVHDEVMGDLDPAKAVQAVELLNDTLNVRVPFRWEMECSESWAMTSPNTLKFFDKIYKGGKELCSLKQYSLCV